MLSTPLSTIRSTFSRLFPPACAGCDGVADGGAFCDICAPLATPLASPHCGRCAVPMREFSSRAAPLSLCSRCRDRRPSFSAVHARWEYRDAVADAIRRIKYGRDFPALRALCRGVEDWFAARLQKLPSTAFIAVPCHPRELQARGFHLPTLALTYLKQRGFDLQLFDRLQKKEPTPSQAGLSLARRRQNVRGVFEYTGPTPPRESTALVFDDVLTSGATADAAATALCAGGYQRVEVVVFARAPAPC